MNKNQQQKTDGERIDEFARYAEVLRANSAQYSLVSIIGESQEIKELKEMIRKSARGHSNVLITGESGTGKELFAHAFHLESERRSGPFISVNCAAIPGELLESEFFGYEEGAFTGARKGGKMGVFQAAHGGTLFLDEIGDLPINMQAKILRVLQERAIQKVGSYQKEPIDIRIVAATNKDLKSMRSAGLFREDLYFRLNVIHIKVPPLRERKEDIPSLSFHLIRKCEELYGIEITGISANAMKAFMRHDWPGNVRELEHVIERAANFLDGEKVIDLQHLPKHITGRSQHLHNMSLKEYMEQIEKKILVETILANNGNKSAVAKELKISRTSLYEKLHKYGLEEEVD
ncbi:MAG: sigma 54-interacting transcriptional regulator [Bacillota bacterium]|nr:sigma 54-interacting transcriptional regulator [Bacillota bacterium]